MKLLFLRSERQVDTGCGGFRYRRQLSVLPKARGEGVAGVVGRRVPSWPTLHSFEGVLTYRVSIPFLACLTNSTVIVQLSVSEWYDRMLVKGDTVITLFLSFFTKTFSSTSKHNSLFLVLDMELLPVLKTGKTRSPPRLKVSIFDKLARRLPPRPGGPEKRASVPRVDTTERGVFPRREL